MEELKPCPFCGGRAEITLSMGFRYVDCIKCHCSTMRTFIRESEAIKGWNKRVKE